MKSLLFVLTLSLSIVTQAHTIHIAILDSGYNTQSKIKLCKEPQYNLTETNTLDDNLNHGKNITGIIAESLGNRDYCLIIVKVFDVKDNYNFKSYMNALYQIWKIRPDIMNFSGGGQWPNKVEKMMYEAIQKNGTTIIVAAGNESQDFDSFCHYFPACYNTDIISVGNLNSFRNRHNSSDYGKRVSAWEIGQNVCGGGLCLTGTSQAAAVHTVNYVKKILDKKFKK